LVQGGIKTKRPAGRTPPCKRTAIIDQSPGLRSNAVMFDEEGTAGRVAIVMGSARGDGNTASAVLHLGRTLGARVRVADLSTLAIHPFDYSRHDDRDDFRSVIETMLASRHIVFATPVYWYSMSGAMKVFFDRLTDLLADPDNRKFGRALAGRDVWLLATGTDEELPPGFHEPFARTAAYFGMVWRQAFYSRVPRGAPLTIVNLSEADELAKLILAESTAAGLATHIVLGRREEE
jgi:multimeric flavodoxin WrbA